MMTRKQICFAGFPDKEVEAVRPSLAEVSTAWRCLFAPDGPFVLSLLKDMPLEAVVADLRTLGMGVAELFDKIALEHPRTLRFALGDFSDREAVANSIGAPYQFISRPWKAGELIAIVERSLSLDAWLANDKLRQFAPRLGRLPHLPTTYFQVVKRAESPDASIEGVAEVIAHDPALTARLLQTANSAVCGRAQRVTSPVEAVSALGLETVKSLVLCLQLFSSPPAPNRSFSLEAAWRLSFAVAQISRAIALNQTGEATLASDAFTAGLLHRIGQVLLATNLPEEYEQVILKVAAGESSLHEQEKTQFGVTSEQLGAYLLGLWAMPLPLVETAALWRNPSASGGHEFSVLTAVHVAATVAYSEHGPLPGIPEPMLDSLYLEDLHLPAKAETWRKHLARNERAARVDEQVTPQPARSSTGSSPHCRTRPSRKVVLLTGFSLLLLTSTLSWFVSSSRARQSASQLASGPRPEPSNGSALPSGPPPSLSKNASPPPFPAIKVEGIFDRPGGPTAVINGKTVAPGEHLGPVRVLSINRGGVLVEFQGERRSFKLKD